MWKQHTKNSFSFVYTAQNIIFPFTPDVSYRLQQIFAFSVANWCSCRGEGLISC